MTKKTKYSYPIKRVNKYSRLDGRTSLFFLGVVKFTYFTSDFIVTLESVYDTPKNPKIF